MLTWTVQSTRPRRPGACVCVVLWGPNEEEGGCGWEAGSLRSLPGVPEAGGAWKGRLITCTHRLELRLPHQELRGPHQPAGQVGGGGGISGAH